MSRVRGVRRSVRLDTLSEILPNTLKVGDAKV